MRHDITDVPVQLSGNKHGLGGLAADVLNPEIRGRTELRTSLGHAADTVEVLQRHAHRGGEGSGLEIPLASDGADGQLHRNAVDGWPTE